MSITKRLNLENNTWLSCRYKIEVEIKFSNGTLRTLKPIQIQKIYLEKDYDGSNLPIMMIDLALSKLDRCNVDDDTEFNIKITQYYIDDFSEEKREPKYFINDTFVRMDFNESTNPTAKLDKKIRELNGMGEEDVSPDDLVEKVTYPLVKKSILSLTKKVNNTVIKNVTMTDAVAWLLSKSGCLRNVLMSNFTNTKRYDEL